MQHSFVLVVCIHNTEPLHTILTFTTYIVWKYIF